MALHESEAQRLQIVLKLMGFLEPLSPAEIEALSWAFEKRPYTKGEVIIMQGDPGDEFFILASGLVGVYDETGGKRRPLHPLGALSCFGELALLNNSLRTATVIGEEDGEVYVLDRLAFEKVLMHNPKVLRLMEEIAADRMAANLNLPSREPEDPRP